MESCSDSIVILDFGSQYTQLIARRIREARVYSVILPPSVSLQALLDHRPKGVIFSGGPASVSDQDAPRWPTEVLSLGLPVLGICYGMQLVAHELGGQVAKTVQREYGRAELMIDDQSDLFKGVGTGTRTRLQAWMSHGDRIESMPKGFTVMAHTPSSPIAAMKLVDDQRRMYGLQFHPEVAHTTNGSMILRNFAYEICGCQPTWTMGSFLSKTVQTIKNQVGSGRVICALSGGVDSAVAAALTHRAVGSHLTCICIDNGLLRKNEVVQLQKIFALHDAIDVKVLDGSSEFLQALARVVNPERKRKIIGRLFIKMFEAEAKHIGQVTHLVQGTLYPDVIESVSFKGPSATIKTHHNVGGLPARMKLQLIEPLRELFKDEVRQLGAELGLPAELLLRHPFPGPGLAVRILGAVTPERLMMLREADAIVDEEIRKAGLYQGLWQAFAVLLPVRTVGVMGDQRTYEHALAIRAVTSVDAMTADWAKLPYELLGTMSNRIINEVTGVNRVVYDVSSKPPGTIEWE